MPSSEFTLSEDHIILLQSKANKYKASNKAERAKIVADAVSELLKAHRELLKHGKLLKEVSNHCLQIDWHSQVWGFRE